MREGTKDPAWEMRELAVRLKAAEDKIAWLEDVAIKQGALYINPDRPPGLTKVT